jgi:TonB family protein
VRRITFVGWVLFGLSAQAPFAMGQTQAVPPADGTSGTKNAPSTVIVESAPPPVTQRPMGPARISGGVIAGNRISFVSPVYPPEAKSAGLSGAVVLHVILSKDGTVENLKVVSSTDPMFDQASIDAVRQWRYRPYLLNGQPTEVDTTVTINFQLNPPASSQTPPGE